MDTEKVEQVVEKGDGTDGEKETEIGNVKHVIDQVEPRKVGKVNTETESNVTR